MLHRRDDTVLRQMLHRRDDAVLRQMLHRRDDAVLRQMLHRRDDTVLRQMLHRRDDTVLRQMLQRQLETVATPVQRLPQNSGVVFGGTVAQVDDETSIRRRKKERSEDINQVCELAAVI